MPPIILCASRLSHSLRTVREKASLFRSISQKIFTDHFLRKAIYATVSCGGCNVCAKSLRTFTVGRFSAVNRPIERGSEYDRAISEVTRCEEALRGKLNPDEMKLLAAYSQACADLSGISCIENFVPRLPHGRTAYVGGAVAGCLTSSNAEGHELAVKIYPLACSELSI